MKICLPGEHVKDITSRLGHWTVCSPDVPGNGLPWDMPTALCAIGFLVFAMGFIGYILWLTWIERNEK
jgi:hypothetical protein